MIYLGDSWPAEYRGSLFMNNIHGARLNRDVLRPNGSGFIGSHAPDFLLANDSWSQIVHLEYGPDGGVFMIDWYDKNQCHHNDVNVHDRTNGRIFKVSYGEARTVPRDLAKLSDQELVRMQPGPNEWHARHARRILQERGPIAEVVEMLRALERQADPRSIGVPLRVLWTLHAVGGLDDPASIAEKLDDPEAMVRAWTIQLATEKRTPAEPILGSFAVMARNDPSPVVRLYLASAAQRLPLGKALGDRRGPGRTRRGRVGPESAAHGLVCRRAAGDDRSASSGPAGRIVADPADPRVHGSAGRRDGHARVAGDPGP